MSALIDALVERGKLSGEQVDEVISSAVAAEALAAERARRMEWQRRIERADQFKNNIAETA